MAQVLEMKFLNEDNKTVTLTIEHPIVPVDEKKVDKVMETIVAANIFQSTGGMIVASKSARIVERTVTDIPLA
ncbi:DUF2922 domain-containing protein [Priestia taiwanensis]|uniref:DUF2922 domain-containing protein n=1 Tax=Priestia taiwanensis TaxID=1347902 RepID=A0A917ARY1_9BACI|nr:DUF2922 domain-containing protein [Priestia taiwanensis]MBM7363303.1 hypothetical protein [Priestia taiwanensis]GGE69307.1 hypothetical protein GCM10007140_19210 [Priestia taiwanensis]